MRGPDHRRITGRIVIATHNPGKLREMRALLAPYGVDAVSAGDAGLSEPDETGTTFSENARIKAEAAAKASGLPALCRRFRPRGGRTRWRAGDLFGTMGRT